jgi:transposase
MDLRERVVLAVERDGLSRNEAARRFGVVISTAVNWLRRHRDTGSVVSGQMGGHRPRKLVGVHRDWLLERAKTDFTLRGLQAELAGRGMTVDYRTVWSFVHDEGLSFKKKACFLPNSCGQRLRAGASSGRSIREGLIRHVSCSSTRPGRRRTWPRCGDGHPGASDYKPGCLTDIGVR